MYFYKGKVHWYLFFLSFLIVSCRSAGPEVFKGYSYDPEGVTETHDREINLQHKRTIGFLEDGVWISNELDGARANNVYRTAPFQYRIEVEPEISPINNSPWYGFKIWSDEPAEVSVELVYNGGRQRYIPKISTDGMTWLNADSTGVEYHRMNNRGYISLNVSPQPTIVSAQEIFTSSHFEHWLDQITAHPFAESSIVGHSHQNNPIHLVKFADENARETRGVIIIYGRQHPPEIPGYLASLHFLETLAGDNELASRFRERFEVWAFPFMNPDGTDNGHWRTNAAGVDLNRDWQYFRQPETAAVRDTLLELQNHTNRKVLYGIDFHSTGQNVFYPISESIKTEPHKFTYRWAENIRLKLPELNLRVEPFAVDSPIAKNWTFKTFGADAVTFEVWDELPRDQVELFAIRSAEMFMELMIEEYDAIFD